MLCVGLALANSHLAAHSLHLLSRIEGENRMRKLMGRDKDREIAYQLLLWAKQNQVGENYFKFLPIKIDSGSEYSTGHSLCQENLLWCGVFYRMQGISAVVPWSTSFPSFSALGVPFAVSHSFCSLFLSLSCGGVGLS